MSSWVKWATLGVLFILVFAQCSHGLEFHLDWNGTFSPPHNEPVLGGHGKGKVARYRFQLEPSLAFKYLLLTGQFNAWGVNTWAPSSSHQSKSWEHDNWSIEEVRYTYKIRAYLGEEDAKIKLFSEYYQPINSAEWGKGGTSMGDYWWLVGFSGRLF